MCPTIYIRYLWTLEKMWLWVDFFFNSILGVRYILKTLFVSDMMDWGRGWLVVAILWNYDWIIIIVIVVVIIIIVIRFVIIIIIIFIIIIIIMITVIISNISISIFYVIYRTLHYHQREYHTTDRHYAIYQ